MYIHILLYSILSYALSYIARHGRARARVPQHAAGRLPGAPGDGVPVAQLLPGARRFASPHETRPSPYAFRRGVAPTPQHPTLSLNLINNNINKISYITTNLTLGWTSRAPCATTWRRRSRPPGPTAWKKTQTYNKYNTYQRTIQTKQTNNIKGPTAWRRATPSWTEPSCRSLPAWAARRTTWPGN